jgi:D-threo-aldose 1-dehydrogenase
MTLHTRPLTLGTSRLGQGTVPGSEQEEAAVSVALDLLASSDALIDTSNNYAGGRSEEVLGLALARRGGDGAARIISKVDADPETGAFDRDRVLRSFEESTRRLGVERLPLVQLHDPDHIPFAEAVGPGGAVEGLRELRDAGVVDAIGIATGPAPLVARYVETGLFDAVLIDDSAAAVFADARERGMTVFNAAPFGGDILVRGPREGSTYAYRPASAELRRWVAELERLCGRHAVPLAAVALHFSLRSPLVDSTIVGVASPGRRARLDELAAIVVPDELWGEIGRLRPAPSPIDDA